MNTLATSIFCFSFLNILLGAYANIHSCLFFVLGAAYSEVELIDQNKPALHLLRSLYSAPCAGHTIWLHRQWWCKLARCRVLCLLMSHFLFWFAFYIRCFSKYEMISHCDVLCLVCACMCVHMCLYVRTYVCRGQRLMPDDFYYCSPPYFF